MTRQINLIGQHITEQGGIRVAIYAPNSIEVLMVLFACSFSHNLTPVLIPFDVPEENLISMLRRSAVDTVVAAAGSFPFDSVVKAYPALRQLIWVVDQGNSHLDWNEVPEGIGGSVSVATWQDIARDAPADTGTELPAADKESTPMDLVTFWQTKPGKQEEMVGFTQANLVSGIAGVLASVPTKAKLGPSDLFLAADSLANIHTLCVTLAALYSNASVAVNSVSGRSRDLRVAAQGVAPTVIVANPATLMKTHEESMSRLPWPLGTLAHWLSTRALTLEGVLATSNMISSFASSAQPSIGTTPGKLRLIFTAERAGSDTPALPPRVLSDLRVLTSSRIVYALSAAKVAGAVTQTAFYDYRVDGDKGHFGAPLTSTEILLKDVDGHKTTDDKVEGEVSYVSWLRPYWDEKNE